MVKTIAPTIAISKMNPELKNIKLNSVYNTRPTTSMLFKPSFSNIQLFQCNVDKKSEFTNSKLIFKPLTNWKAKLEKIIRLKGTLDQLLALNERGLTFNIITTNKKSTAIAPT